jgi:hypothetical protein
MFPDVDAQYEFLDYCYPYLEYVGDCGSTNEDLYRYLKTRYDRLNNLPIGLQQKRPAYNINASSSSTSIQPESTLEVSMYETSGDSQSGTSSAPSEGQTLSVHGTPQRVYPPGPIVPFSPSTIGRSLVGSPISTMAIPEDEYEDLESSMVTVPEIKRLSPDGMDLSDFKEWYTYFAESQRDKAENTLVTGGNSSSSSTGNSSSSSSTFIGAGGLAPSPSKTLSGSPRSRSGESLASKSPTKQEQTGFGPSRKYPRKTRRARRSSRRH